MPLLAELEMKSEYECFRGWIQAIRAHLQEEDPDLRASLAAAHRPYLNEDSVGILLKGLRARGASAESLRPLLERRSTSIVQHPWPTPQ